MTLAAILGTIGLIVVALFTGYLWGARQLHTARNDAQTPSPTGHNNPSMPTLKPLADSALVGLALCDSDGLLRQVNRTFCELCGSETRELTGRPLHSMLLPEHRAEAAQAYQNAVDGAPDPVREWCFVHRDGTPAWARVEARLLAGADEPHVVFVTQNITPQKETEHTLAQCKADLTQSTIDLDMFAHGIAHDLKNPLGLIVGYGDLLVDDYAQSGDERLLADLKVIDDACNQMVSIIDELMVLVAVRRNRYKIAPVDSAAIVDKVQQRLEPLIAELAAQITLPDRWPVAVGCDSWVEKVWTNYLRNALQYGGRPPEIQIGAHTDENGHIRFWVRDNGPGLSPDEQAQLFRPFVRLTNRDIPGRGMGLALSRRIVHKLGGDVDVRSTPGQGSEFGFSLPAHMD